MAYRWKPSASQRKEFALKMQDPEEAAAYSQRKEARAEKRRSTSKYDYLTAGGSYIPTLQQHNFVFDNMHLFQTVEETEAANQILYGYSCQEKISHDHIHIVNEKMRKL
jgi:hypothetical protein